MGNQTDYQFPQWWGLLQQRVNDDDDPLTKADADEIRSDWFTHQRVLRQLERQHDAGMWEQWSDVNGQSVESAMNRATENPYRDK